MREHTLTTIERAARKLPGAALLLALLCATPAARATDRTYRLDFDGDGKTDIGAW